MSLEFLKSQNIGDWVVIDPAMTKVVASAATPEEALRKAGIDPHAESSSEPRPVIMQVPDPSLTCLY